MANGGLVIAAALLVLLLVAQSGAQRPGGPSRAMRRLQPRFTGLRVWPATLPITSLKLAGSRPGFWPGNGHGLQTGASDCRGRALESPRWAPLCAVTTEALAH